MSDDDKKFLELLLSTTMAELHNFAKEHPDDKFYAEMAAAAEAMFQRVEIAQWLSLGPDWQEPKFEGEQDPKLRCSHRWKK
jgi:hypothetical protein